jgi:hypothetical protein
MSLGHIFFDCRLRYKKLKRKKRGGRCELRHAHSREKERNNKRATHLVLVVTTIVWKRETNLFLLAKKSNEKWEPSQKCRETHAPPSPVSSSAFAGAHVTWWSFVWHPKKKENNFPAKWMCVEILTCIFDSASATESLNCHCVRLCVYINIVVLVDYVIQLFFVPLVLFLRFPSTSFVCCCRPPPHLLFVVVKRQIVFWRHHHSNHARVIQPK